MKHDATKDFFEHVAVRCRDTRPAGGQSSGRSDGST
ncbi:hypothetical protein ACFX1S_027073 [Malus domestica]